MNSFSFSTFVILTFPFDAGRQFPHFHVAVVLHNKTVLDISMVEKYTPSTRILFQLPLHPNANNTFAVAKYHGYSDARGVLYFIDAETRFPVTKYHPNLSQKGHLTIANSKGTQRYCDQFAYYQSLMISTHFWLHSSTARHCSHVIDDITREETIIWHTKRQLMQNGPKLPKQFLEVHGFLYTCTVALNQSHAVMLGIDSSSYHNYKAMLLNFKSNHWSHWPSLPLKNGHGYRLDGCRATLSYSSKGQRIIYVHLQVKHFFPERMKHYIMSNDVSKGHWNTVHQFWTDSLSEIST